MNFLIIFFNVFFFIFAPVVAHSQTNQSFDSVKKLSFNFVGFRNESSVKSFYFQVLLRCVDQSIKNKAIATGVLPPLYRENFVRTSSPYAEITKKEKWVNGKTINALKLDITNKFNEFLSLKLNDCGPNPRALLELIVVTEALPLSGVSHVATTVVELLPDSEVGSSLSPESKDVPLIGRTFPWSGNVTIQIN
ncbi:MAG: hypothetical protein QE271_10650 [Bacteriovoracaceae bacterium]|nr:hypothetical protein [Bacteriovoracaceae bacterium]